MNSMKRQWQQWIRMRSKIHGAQAKPVLSVREDSAMQRKMVLPKPYETQEIGMGPQGGLSTEKQTYYESVARSHVSQLIQLKQEYINNPDERISATAEKAAERLANSIPDKMRKTVLSCPQAFHIIVSLALIGVKNYPVKLIEHALEVVTLKSYSIPGNKFYPLLRSIALLGPPKLKSMLHDMSPRLLQVMCELTQREIACIIGLFGEKQLFEDTLVGKMLSLFLDSAENPDFVDLKVIFIGLYQIEFHGDKTLVAVLAEKLAKSYTTTLNESLPVTVKEVVLLLQASLYFQVDYVPLCTILHKYIEENLTSLSISQAADIVCAFYRLSPEGINVIQYIHNAIQTNQSALGAVKAVKLWIALLRFHVPIGDAYFLCSSIALKKWKCLSPLQLSQTFLQLAEVIAQHTSERTLCFLRHNCESNSLLSDFFSRLKEEYKDLIPFNACLNILAALGKLDYLKLGASSALKDDFSSESVESRVSYVGKLLSNFHGIIFKPESIQERQSFLAQRALLTSMNARCHIGDRRKCRDVREYFFTRDDRFARESCTRNLSDIFSDVLYALKSVTDVPSQHDAI